MLKKEKKRAADAVTRLENVATGHTSSESHNGHYKHNSGGIANQTVHSVNTFESSSMSSSHKSKRPLSGRSSGSSSKNAQQMSSLERERDGIRSENEERTKKKICKYLA